MKALRLLQSTKSVNERAESYAERIKTSLNIKLILPLQVKIEKLEDKIFDLENFSLDTNLNKGMRTMTKEDCEQRFEEIIEATYQIELLKMELRAKLNSFNALFDEELEEVKSKSKSKK